MTIIEAFHCCCINKTAAERVLSRIHFPKLLRPCRSKISKEGFFPKTRPIVSLGNAASTTVSVFAAVSLYTRCPPPAILQEPRRTYIKRCCLTPKRLVLCTCVAIDPQARLARLTHNEILMKLRMCGDLNMKTMECPIFLFCRCFYMSFTTPARLCS